MRLFAAVVAILIGAIFIGQSPPPPATVFTVTCADTTGAIECGTQMQAAEDACAASPGGTVVYPAGELLNQTGVIIRSGCRHTGQGWQLWKGNGSLPGHGTQGTYISQKLVAGVPPANSAFTLTDTATGAVIERMAFVQEHAPDATGWTPAAYQASIKTSATGGAAGFVVRNALFWGVSRAIQLGTGAGIGGSGLITVHGSTFNCFIVCINTVFAGDFNNFYDLKFSSDLIPGNPNQIAYIRTHAVGIASAYADDPAYSKIRMFGQHIGVLFTGNSSGSTSKFQLTDYDCDGCGMGVYVNWPGAYGSINGMNFRGYDTSSVGIYCIAACRLRGSNVTIENAGISAILAAPESGTADIAISNLDVINCNTAGGWAALYAGSGGTITISGRWSYSGGNCTTEKAGNVLTSHAN